MTKMVMEYLFYPVHVCACVCLQWHKTAINFVLFGNIEHNDRLKMYAFLALLNKFRACMKNNAQSIKSGMQKVMHDL